MGSLNRIIIVHGWTHSKDKWENFVKLAEAKPTILSIPGLTELNDKVWNLEDYVEWLRKILEKEKGKIILIGHSNGGKIALAFAAKYPENLSNLILIDSGGIYHNDFVIKMKRNLFKSLAKIGKILFPSQSLRDILYKLTGEKDYKNASPTLRETMKNLISVDLTNILDKIKIPTLIIWGDKDKLTPLSDGKLMNKLIKGSKFYIINSAGHSPHFTHPQKVWEIIRKVYKNENI